MVEVGDLLASRLRYITSGVETKCFKAARHFLVYHYEDNSLVSESMMDAALEIEKAEQSREERLAKARGSKTAGR